MKLSLPLLVLFAVSSTGCATLFASKTKNITVHSNVQGAQVLLDGALVGTAPGVVNVIQKKSHTITVRAPGYADVHCVHESSVGALWVVLDIVGTWFLGLLIDAATGDWKQIENGTCFANFAGSPAAAPPAAAPPVAAPPPPPTAPPPAQGTEGNLNGPCYGNYTCNEGLVCDRELGRCVLPQ